MKRFPLLYTLNKKDIREISQNFRISRHARQRIDERLDARIPVSQLVCQSKLAYVNNDKDHNVTVVNQDGTAFVFAQPSGSLGKFVLVTLLDKTRGMKDYKYKQQRTMKGYRRS